MYPHNPHQESASNPGMDHSLLAQAMPQEEASNPMINIDNQIHEFDSITMHVANRNYYPDASLIQRPDLKAIPTTVACCITQLCVMHYSTP